MAGSSSIAQYSIFGAYDLAVSRWCRRLISGVEGSESIPIVAASPMRAFGEAKRVIERNTVPGTFQSSSTPVPKVPLPMVSITRGEIEHRGGRIYPFSGLFRGWLPTTDEDRRLRFESRPPIPLTIGYQIDIWSKTVNMQSALVDKFIEVFDPKTAYGMVSPHADWGTYRMPIHWISLNDSSELEGGDDGDRIIRHTLAVSVEAWKFFDVTTALTALSTTISENMDGVSVAWLKNKKYKAVYLQSKQGLWFQLTSVNHGMMNLIPCRAPSTPKLYTETLIALQNGLTLQESPGLYYTVTWNVYSQDMDFTVDPVNDEGVEDVLVIQKEQNLLVGQPEGTQYGQFRISGTGDTLYKERVLIEPPETA